MPLVPIPINKGVYENIDPLELSSPDSAAVLKNISLTDTGANTDRPALSILASIGTYPVIGSAFFQDKCVFVNSNRRIYSMDSSYVVTDITGDPLGGTARPTFATDGEFLAIAGGGTLQIWDGTGTTDTMAGSPEESTHIAYLDGYWINFLIDDQELRIAGPTPTARLTWNSSDFFQAEGLPDNVKAIAVVLRELYAFGKSSIEIFQNFGDSSTPFGRSFFIDQGTEAYSSIVFADNTLFYLDSLKRQFSMLSGRTPTLISSPFDKTIKRMGTVTDCIGSRIDIDGSYFIVWTFPTEERTLVYDYQKKEWFEWDGYEGDREVRFRGNSYVYADTWNKHIVGDYRNGTIYELTSTAKSDGDNVLKRIRRTGAYDHGSSVRKKSNFYRFHMKRGVGTPGGVEPVFTVRVNDDNEGWSEPQLIGLGFPGETSKPLEVEMRGIYRKRQLEISMTDPAQFLLTKLEEDVTPLGS